MPQAAVQDLLRLSPADRKTLIEVLNNRPNDDEARKHRRSDRYRYFVPEGLAIELRQNEASLGTFLVSPRNLSTGGLAFLHGAFIYSGTKCIVQLKARDGKTHEACGEVVRCRSIHGRIHEVGMRFHVAIEIDKFVDTSTPTVLPRDLPYNAVDLVGLARRVQDQAFHGAPVEDIRATVRELARVVRVAEGRSKPHGPQHNLPTAEEVPAAPAARQPAPKAARQTIR